ncbi:pyridoxamine 5'-phosphate oxidase [Kibdelosporangium banguiense]|uniref:Pyridoxamine 5'-phosphate oxidase n=1 Tax=Kibdelosporangium banguiense TaxID=1365924 RepID=A0ABS4TKN7_9PSEU|nr:phenazine biosynthesis FMN-dependent oxidase PhzG [Kibdelosporangium banguiense]MBP2324993.1 pyridoxamine 5'-phosphate oxidase [Kibdelosporangium banguiense]
MNTAFSPVGAEFRHPAADPITLLRDWLTTAGERGVQEPGAIALATVAADGKPSSRMIQTLRVSDRGLVFTSHSVSPKGRDIAATGRASGVLYWRETNQQVTVSGRVEQLPAQEADTIWYARPVSTHPMSVAAHQSEPLIDEDALRAKAEQLGAAGKPLPRPETWVAYELVPDTLEFWQSTPDRLYQRLRYDRSAEGWSAVRLQP